MVRLSFEAKKIISKVRPAFLPIKGLVRLEKRSNDFKGNIIAQIYVTRSEAWNIIEGQELKGKKSNGYRILDI